MNKTKADKLNSLTSKKESGWLEKAQWREENEAWLDISFAIAVKILSALRENKKTDSFPKTQKDLAEAMDCTPQYVNKVLKGAENLQLETISKIGKILNTQLIEIPEFKKSKEETTTTKAETFENLISAIERSKEVLKNKTRNPNVQASKIKKVEQKGMSYSSLMNEFTFEEDLDTDPNCPLKIVA